LSEPEPADSPSILCLIDSTFLEYRKQFIVIAIFDFVFH